jgi:hypothetical protein
VPIKHRGREQHSLARGRRMRIIVHDDIVVRPVEVRATAEPMSPTPLTSTITGALYSERSRLAIRLIEQDRVIAGDVGQSGSCTSLPGRSPPSSKTSPVPSFTKFVAVVEWRSAHAPRPKEGPPIAAGFSALSSLLIWRIQRSTSLESIRPDLELVTTWPGARPAAGGHFLGYEAHTEVGLQGFRTIESLTMPMP